MATIPFIESMMIIAGRKCKEERGLAEEQEKTVKIPALRWAKFRPPAKAEDLQPSNPLGAAPGAANVHYKLNPGRID